MAIKLAYNKARYLTSAAEIKQLPSDFGWEVAFIGRSNAGKSSAINTITNIKGLARTSDTPGRTQMINLFALDEERRFVDLPGYGYAKVPRHVKERWEQVTSQYLHTRNCLRGLILIMDIRHPLTEMDQNLINWTLDSNVALHILLTKSDKISRQSARKILKEVEENLRKLMIKLVFSSFLL